MSQSQNKNPTEGTPAPVPKSTLDALLRRAVEFHRKGRLDEASAGYRRMLELAPGNADALHLLGVAACQQRDYSTGLDLIDRAIAAAPAVSSFHGDRAYALKELGRLEEAIVSCDKAIALDPKNAAAHVNRGNALREQKKFVEAVAAYDAAIALAPDSLEAWFNRGMTLRSAGRLVDVPASFERVLKIAPDHLQAATARAAALRDLGRLREALDAYDRALGIDPSHSYAQYHRSLILEKLGRGDEAQIGYQRSIELFEGAVRLKPDDAVVHHASADVLWRLGRLDEALRSCDRAIALLPDSANAWCTRGTVFAELGDIDRALENFDHALRCDPGNVEATWHKSLMLLLKADFDRGWPLYESRAHKPTFGASAEIGKPRWNGEQSLAGKTLLLRSEQGLGDTIQFSRYAAVLTGRGAKVVLEVQKPLTGLFRSMKGVAAVVSKGEGLPDFDLYCPLLSAPLACGTRADTIPGDVPYLAADPESLEAWRRRLGRQSKPRIGIVWSGNPSHVNDRTRSLTLDAFRPLLADRFEWVSLQKEVRHRDLATLGELAQLRHFGDELRDFTDTAALCELVDLVISVDTSVVHLAGALGRPVWILLPSLPDWRWMLDRDDSPWYPRAKLYRRLQKEGWDEVMRRVARDLEVFPAVNRKPFAASVPEGRSGAGHVVQSTTSGVFGQLKRLEGKSGPRGGGGTSSRKAAEVKALFDAAAQRHAAGDVVEARKLFRQVVAMAPDHAYANNMLGIICSRSGDFEEGMACFARAIGSRPEHPAFHNNRGILFRRRGDPEEALANFSRAIALAPSYAEAYNNRGNSLRDLGRIGEAITDYDKALQLRPDFSDAIWNKALAYLLNGDLMRGLPLYEWRWKKEAAHARRECREPLWLGDDGLEGKTILLHSEQGYGDTLQFCRYAKLAADRGATVIVEVQQPLVSLLRSLSGASQVFSTGDPLPSFDVHCPLLSLPLAFGTRLDSIPSAQSYLRSAPALVEKWRRKLGDRTGPRVGIAWSGNPAQKNDRHRSMELSMLMPLLSDEYEWISLQRDVRDRDIPALQGAPRIRHFGHELGDFADTAALCELVDLVISVDTSVAHLAGALGRPVWVLLSKAPDWRWLLDREDSPWYPTATLYRQQQFGDWAGVLERCGSDLRKFFPGTRPAVGVLRKKKTSAAVAGPENVRKSEELMRHALDLHGKGRMDEAEAFYREILTGVPEHPDALHLMGVIASQRGDYQTSLRYIDRAIAVNPRVASFHSNRGYALKELGRPGDAVESCDKAISLDRNLAAAHGNRANALMDLRRFREALASYDEAVQLAPGDTNLHGNRANALRELGRLEEALAACDRAIELDPQRGLAWCRRGSILHYAGRLEEALEAYERAVACDFERDESVGDIATKADAYNDMGNVLIDAGRLDEALASYDKALEMRSNAANALWNKTHVYLLRGDFERGLPLYESRWQRSELTRSSRQFEEPLWLGGEPLEGKSILLHAEQGLGDTLQFCRYAKLVAGLGATVYLEVQPALVPLLENVEGAAKVLRTGAKHPPCDFHCPLLSLPLALGTRVRTIPSATSYIRSDPARLDRWRRRLGEQIRPRIGIAWSGNPEHRKDRNRSVPLALMASMLSADYEWICLQKDVREDDANVLRNLTQVRHFGSELHDFSDTAALCELLDLVISVDTSIAHLAGALGRPVWVLISKSPDWRWMLGRRDSPWYPTATLYRQTRFGDWSAVFQAVQGDLGKLFGKTAAYPGSVTTDRMKRTSAVIEIVPESGGKGRIVISPERKMTVRASSSQGNGNNRITGLVSVNHQKRGPDSSDGDARNDAFRAAVRLYESGQLERAKSDCLDLLSRRPDRDDVRHLLGVIACRQGDFAGGIELMGAVVERNPTNAEYRGNLCSALAESGDLRKSLELLDGFLALDSGKSQLWCIRANVLDRLGRTEDAIRSYDRALALRPDDVEALQSRGALQLKVGRPADALDSYGAAIALEPGTAGSYCGRGIALARLHFPGEALAEFDRAIELEPGKAEAHNGRGNALTRLSRPGEALASYEKAIALKPEYAQAWSNRGIALKDLMRLDDALSSYDRALELDPEYVDAHWNRALLYLLQGDYGRGWRFYEWRWKRKDAPHRETFTQPLWSGKESLSGKTVLLHSEQGLGDSIQFCRYAALVAARGATVLMRVEPALASLFASLSGVTRILETGAPLPHFDYQCPFLSLPLALGTCVDTIPAAVPYLRVGSSRIRSWQRRLGRHDRLRVGIAWSGNPVHKNDHNRSIPFADMLPFLSPQYDWICLQKDIRTADCEIMAKAPHIRHFGPELRDFSDTAALCMSVDLVISVDTSVAHLAGALGCPLRLLLPTPPDWRWLLGRTDSPWYPTAKLYRQARPGEWHDVLARVTEDLVLLANRRRGATRKTGRSKTVGR